MSSESIFLGSPVKAQLREALSALEGKIAPDLLVELRNVRQLDLLFEGEPHDHSRCVCFGQVGLAADPLKQCEPKGIRPAAKPNR